MEWCLGRFSLPLWSRSNDVSDFMPCCILIWNQFAENSKLCERIKRSAEIKRHCYNHKWSVLQWQISPPSASSSLHHYLNIHLACALQNISFKVPHISIVSVEDMKSKRTQLPPARIILSCTLVMPGTLHNSAHFIFVIIINDFVEQKATIQTSPETERRRKKDFINHKQYSP